jgi:hypothetical protein
MGVGLDAPNWERDFFPEDLPEDWRLDYYANEYPGILIPQDVWAEGLDVEEWIENLSEDFEFHFQVTAGMPDESLKRLIQAADALGTRLKGLLLESRDREGYSTLVDRLAVINSGRKISVMTPYEGLPLCWQPDIQAGTACGPGLIRLERDIPPRQLRALIESYAADTVDEAPILFVRAPVAVLETLKTLLDLMGH